MPQLDTLVALALALDLNSLDELFAAPATPASQLFDKHLRDSRPALVAVRGEGS